MCCCKVPILKCNKNIKEVLIYPIEQFTSLMCLKDTEDTEIQKDTSEDMEKTRDCPLCLDPLEYDDKNFFPCACGYQVCRFCWHRIRTNENGLCPACRRTYPENPANFQPLTPEEMQKVRHQNKLKNQLKKQKIAESRKQLANIRVIQKNLVFAVGLPLELSQDNEKKEKVLNMFRQYGSTQKETITDRTTYAGSLGPSACVYITYQKPEDAVRAVKSLTNTKIEGRTIKVSLGTTKYCSNFLKNCQCPKSECLYLHELADDEASFTKEDIHSGKHLEYEQKLLEQTLNSTSHSKVVIPSTENNRTNHNRTVDDCSESSDELHQSNSFYDSSEASELSPSSNSQNIENIRNIGSDLNIETENNHQNMHPSNSDLNIDSSPKQGFRSAEENVIVNNHSSNSSVQDISFNSNCANQMVKESEALQQPNFFNNHIFESALQCRGLSSNSKESTFLRLINSASLVDGGLKNPVQDVKLNQEQVNKKMRDDDPDLEFDPCQESLNGLQQLLISEAKERINRPSTSALNRTPISHRSPTLPYEPYEVPLYRNIPTQQLKIRDPPPGFPSNTQNPQNLFFKPQYDAGSLNKAPIALHNQLGVRTNYNVQRYSQPVIPTNNAFLPDFTSTLSREIPDIIPPTLQQQQQQQQQHNQQRLMNLSQMQYPVTEQRSSPLWNHTSPSQWRPMENLFFNQSISENRSTNDFNMRMPVRSNDIPMRQFQQLPGNNFN